MNLQQLYYFRKLAEVQHYTEAAKALYITQPSLSDSIASLEHELSVSLFQKKGRGVQLTKYGQEFYEYVNQALGILEHGIAAVREKSDSVTGTIDIGCHSDASWRFSPECPRSLPRKMSAGKLQYLQ
ncbi:MAG: LysR family transcriptional regulator [Clostridium sp.]